MMNLIVVAFVLLGTVKSIRITGIFNTTEQYTAALLLSYKTYPTNYLLNGMLNVKQRAYSIVSAEPSDSRTVLKYFQFPVFAISKGGIVSVTINSLEFSSEQKVFGKDSVWFIF